MTLSDLAFFQDCTQQSRFSRYHVQLKFRDKVMGGTPANPDIVRGWLMTRMGLKEDQELAQEVAKTLRDQGLNVPDDSNWQEIKTLAEDWISVREGNGFRTDPTHGLYLEARCIKAMLKECGNICFARMGTPNLGDNKSFKNSVAERVFVSPDRVYLGKMKRDDRHLFIGHTSGPKGPQSNMTYYDFVEQARIEFDIAVLDDFIPRDWWFQIWEQAERNGLGALRSQGFGTFEVEDLRMTWRGVDNLPKPKAPKEPKTTKVKVA